MGLFAHTELSIALQYCEEFVSPIVPGFIDFTKYPAGTYAQFDETWSNTNFIYPSKLGYWGYRLRNNNRYAIIVPETTPAGIRNALHSQFVLPDQDNLDYIDWASASINYLALSKLEVPVYSLQHKNWILRNFFILRKVAGAFLKYHLLENRNNPVFIVARLSFALGTRDERPITFAGEKQFPVAVLPIAEIRKTMFQPLISIEQVIPRLTELNVTYCKANQDIQKLIWEIEPFTENNPRNMSAPTRPPMVTAFLTNIEITYSEKSL